MFNQQIIDEFRANGGQVAMFPDARLLLLTSTGARSGESHTTPLGYLPDGGERMIVIASAGGSPKHPDWYHNVVAHPLVTVEAGRFTFQAKASVLTGQERDEAFARAVETDQGWAEYERRSGRQLPVVVLETVSSGPPQASSFGEALRMVHDSFRRELALVRKELAASGPKLGAQLRINCLTACQGLHFHHTMEDTGLFPRLVAQHPELDQVMARLREEHEKIAVILAALQELLSAEGAGDVLAEVDRLIEELEAHLDYEEEQLIPILDA
ncbi:nitroreductase/quinone reductase family protein [Nonomuraea soli]|uniref:Deazaflavin-dependent oxidoreductase (Nitroreductase family) n=1 Tax=Nonomuraea soli TaxID=1032476 RepID=A0A7W0CTH0_9ACTN|nr:nitroreductase/quinone reductase family protein [Nonomuraea soli]MBA2896970.1 deazaflavin-dependent oxidoreductase (nitroreductase family) [Nonomuraea soli]